MRCASWAVGPNWMIYKLLLSSYEIRHLRVTAILGIYKMDLNGGRLLL